MNKEQCRIIARRLVLSARQWHETRAFDLAQLAVDDYDLETSNELNIENLFPGIENLFQAVQEFDDNYRAIIDFTPCAAAMPNVMEVPFAQCQNLFESYILYEPLEGGRVKIGFDLEAARAFWQQRMPQVQRALQPREHYAIDANLGIAQKFINGLKDGKGLGKEELLQEVDFEILLRALDCQGLIGCAEYENDELNIRPPMSLGLPLAFHRAVRERENQLGPYTFPVLTNLGRSHWVCIAFAIDPDNQTAEVSFYNSLSHSRNLLAAGETQLRQAVQFHSQEQRPNPETGNMEDFVQEAYPDFADANINVHCSKSAYQRDYWSCGYYSLINGLKALGKTVDDPNPNVRELLTAAQPDASGQINIQLVRDVAYRIILKRAVFQEQDIQLRHRHCFTVNEAGHQLQPEIVDRLISLESRPQRQPRLNGLRSSGSSAPVEANKKHGLSVAEKSDQFIQRQIEKLNEVSGKKSKSQNKDYQKKKGVKQAESWFLEFAAIESLMQFLKSIKCDSDVPENPNVDKNIHCRPDNYHDTIKTKLIDWIKENREGIAKHNPTFWSRKSKIQFFIDGFLNDLEGFQRKLRSEPPPQQSTLEWR